MTKYIQITINVEDDEQARAYVHRIDPDGSDTLVHDTSADHIKALMFDLANDVANGRIPHLLEAPIKAYPIGTVALLHKEQAYIRGAGGWYYADRQAGDVETRRSIDIANLDDETVRAWSKNANLCQIIFEPES